MHLDRPRIPAVAVNMSAVTLDPRQRRLVYGLRCLIRCFVVLKALTASRADPSEVALALGERIGRERDEWTPF